MADALAILAALSLAAWIYLLLARRFFWRAGERLGGGASEPDPWPEIVAVVPARDEAEFVGRAIASLLHQDYPGAFSVVLVDDGSRDGTAEAARAAAASANGGERFLLVEARPPEPGWTGKMWAVSEGVNAALTNSPKAQFIWLGDADIEHDPGELRALVAKAEADRLDLVSLMVRLHCGGRVERLLIPAFVFFFQKLYPFPAVNDPKSRVAAAAGGSMLVRTEALQRAGGIASIRDALIDDCALAARIKSRGPIWLGLAAQSRSLRPYDGITGVWHMVSRTAFTQLRHSPARLLGAVAGMVLVYLAPPAILLAGALYGEPLAAILAGAALASMWFAYWPTYRLYSGRRGAFDWQFLALPLAAFLYTAMTVDSALKHWRGRGGGWKGRTFAPPPPAA
jgi:hopene-associated glycosyltransferase HpnB